MARYTYLEQSHKTVKMAQRPRCDFCRAGARVDGQCVRGGWAYMCDVHFARFGIGLGMGRGQRIETPRQAQPKTKNTRRQKATPLEDFEI